MLTRKAIECALVLLCLVGTACDAGENQEQSGSSNKPTEHSQQVSKDLKNTRDHLAAAATAVGKAHKALSGAPAAPDRSPGSSPPGRIKPKRPANSPDPEKKPSPATVEAPDSTGASEELKVAVASLGQALSSFDSMNSALVAAPVTGETRAAVEEVKTSVNSAVTKLDDVIGEIDALPKKAGENVPKDELDKAKGNLKEVQRLIDSATKSAAHVTVPSTLSTPPSFFGQLLSDWGTVIAIALGAVFALILLIFGAKALTKSISAELDNKFASRVQPLLTSIHKQQKDLANQSSALASSDNQLNTRLGDLQKEVHALARLVRDSSLDSGARRPSGPTGSYQQIEPPTPLRNEPIFPISTVDYLAKMRRFAVVVKPDFQNGILVADPYGKGELALIRDSGIDDDVQPLFVVPTAAQFQTKQDFHTYYEKYYDCARPSAGEVWIVDPAVVSKVQGGWLLREKGVMEIR